MPSYKFPVPRFPEDVPIDGYFQRKFLSTEADCEAFMVQLRWPRGVICPRCDYDGTFRDEARHRFGCVWCDYRFTVRTLTWLHRSKTSLGVWIRTGHGMTSRTNGISATESSEEERIGSHTAWTLEHVYREVMQEDLGNEPPLAGVVEVDETWIGGRGRGHTKRRNAKKRLVLGIKERGGRVFLEEAQKRSRKALHAFILRHTGPGLIAIYTDGLASYKGIDVLTGAVHEVVIHKNREYVREEVHTNTIESVWAGLDWMILATYRRISREFLPLYLAEHAWRHNHRGIASRDVDLLRLLLQTPGYMLLDWAEERRRLGL